MSRPSGHLHAVVRRLLVVSVTVALGAWGIGNASAAFSWRQFQGTTLHVLLSDSHWQQVMQASFPDFEERTGIKLAVEVFPQGQLWDVLEHGLDEPGRVDVFMTVPNLDGLRFLRLGKVHPVTAFLRDPDRTAPEFAWDDILPKTRAAMEWDGEILGPPVMGEHLALLYRKDLFQDSKMTAPATLAELEAAARFFQSKTMEGRFGRGVGVVMRGQGTLATSVYAGVLHALGGHWLDAEGRSTVASQESVSALEMLGRLATCSSTRLTTFGWQEALEMFSSGSAAMYLEGSSIYPLLEENSASRVRGKVGYALFPSGPGGPGTSVAVKGLAIGARSSNPAAAWLFLQWAAGPEMSRRALQKGVLVGRQSTWRDPALDPPVPADLAQSFQQAGRIGNPVWAPPMVAVTAGRETIGKAVEAAFKGEDVRAAAQAAQQRMAEIQAATEPASSARRP
ncbi:MAG TPA: extracellular solute-binding protein [Candidatus Sulfotelmatobacter sp.]|nr:extracellular solute-binding protein [Candidatus Sulfotelmatobacter sp.]